MRSIYVSAARRVAESSDDYDLNQYTNEWKASGCCAALAAVDASEPEKEAFKKVFYRSTATGYWWVEPHTYRSGSWKDQQARILALLFMHWIAIDEHNERRKK